MMYSSSPDGGDPVGSSGSRPSLLIGKPLLDPVTGPFPSLYRGVPLQQGPKASQRTHPTLRASHEPHPISWHDLRHQFVSLLICAGKHPKQISTWARHTDAGFTMKQYGHLFDSVPITPVEWWDDLLWPAGCPYSANRRGESGHGEGALIAHGRVGGES